MQTDRFWIWLILLLTAPAYFLTLQDGHHWGGDFAVYLQEATNIAQGEPISAHQYTVTPRSALNHPSLYPPVPALLLAPVYAFQGLNYRAMKAILALFWWLALPLWYLVGKRMGLTPPWSAGVVLAFGFGALPLLLKETIGSDGVYLWVSGGAILTILWLEDRGLTVERPAWAAAAVAGLLLLSYATRATALALLGAAIVNEFWRVWESRPSWRMRAFGWYLLLFLGVGVMIYTKFIYDSRGQYGSQFVIDGRLYLDNFLFYLRMPAALWSASPAVLRYALSGLTMGCGLVSLVRAWRRPTVVEFYVLLFWAMLVLYVVADFRYSLPILLPMLLLAARLLSAYAPQPAVLALAGLGVAAAALNVRAMLIAPVAPGPQLAAFREVAGFLRQAPPDTVLLSWNPRLFAYYTQRTSALSPRTPAELAREIPFLAKKRMHLAEAGSKLGPLFRN